MGTTNNSKASRSTTGEDRLPTPGTIPTEPIGNIPDESIEAWTSLVVRAACGFELRGGCSVGCGRAHHRPPARHASGKCSGIALSLRHHV